jgi:RNA polymerase sigma factor (sigma-70 family)
MAENQLSRAMHHIRRTLGVSARADLNDRQLLEQFATSKDEEAFTLLVHRYGPQVLGVCRRMLGNDHDADDVFQATFLVLASKAGSVSWRESIGSWLYNVAYHLAAKTRRGAARRRQHEQWAATMAPQNALPSPDGEELQSIVDDELQRLPGKYRMPLLLCYLQGQTRDEAARQLGWTQVEVKGRLQRGRDLLRDRLLRRGLATSAAMLPATLSQDAIAAVPTALVTTTVKAAVGGAVAAPVAALVKGAVNAMYWSKIKTRALIALVIATVFGFGMSGFIYYYPSGASAQQVPAKDTNKPPEAASKRDDPRVDPDRYDQADVVARVKLKGGLIGTGQPIGGGRPFTVKSTTFTILELLKNKTAIALDKEVSVSNFGPHFKIDNVIRAVKFDEEFTIYLKLQDSGPPLPPAPAAPPSWNYIENSNEKGVSHLSASKPKQ